MVFLKQKWGWSQTTRHNTKTFSFMMVIMLTVAHWSQTCILDNLLVLFLFASDGEHAVLIGKCCRFQSSRYKCLINNKYPLKPIRNTLDNPFYICNVTRLLVKQYVPWLKWMYTGTNTSSIWNWLSLHTRMEPNMNVLSWRIPTIMQIYQYL